MKVYKNKLVYTLEFLSAEKADIYEPEAMKDRIQQCLSMYNCVKDNAKIELYSEKVEV